MSALWTLADLIDLHYFRQLDEEFARQHGSEALAKRDRIIYLAKIEPQLGKADAIPPRILVRKWLTIRRLQQRRELTEDGPLPGTVWLELAAACRMLAFGSGLLSGLALAGSLLVYAGTTPLNVAVYFGLFVGLQWLILGCQAVLLCYRRLRRIPLASTGLYLLLGRALIRGLDAVRRRLHRRLSGQQRLDLAALAGGVRQRQELAALLIWPAFILVQLAGIGCNLGVLGATLAKVAFFDIAFAWQSSLPLTAGLVAELVRWIALPWSWAVDQAYPTLAQIQGSQVVLKEGIGHLATADLVSWWPFLCWSVAIYGLLPRCGLLLLGLVRQRRTLDQLHFATLGLQPLLQRMTTPRIDTNGGQDTAHAAAPPTGTDVPRPVKTTAAPATPASGPELAGSTASWLLLIPDELYEECPLPALSGLLHPHIGPARIDPVRFGALDLIAGRETEFPASLSAVLAQGQPAGVLLLQEAWQPPLKETELFVRGLRRMVAPQTPLIILLIGKPAAASILTPVDPGQWLIWRQKMAALGDPAVAVHPLVTP